MEEKKREIEDKRRHFEDFEVTFDYGYCGFESCFPGYGVGDPFFAWNEIGVGV